MRNGQRSEVRQGQVAEEQEKQFRAEVLQALPEQARHRAVTTLVTGDSTCPIVSCEHIDGKGGVAYCPKVHVPTAIVWSLVKAHPLCILKDTHHVCCGSGLLLQKKLKHDFLCCPPSIIIHLTHSNMTQLAALGWR
eukprot:6489767-Amphidinium_carterae.2